MRFKVYIAAFAAALLLSLVGCAQRGRIIPESDMVKLYKDMFLADQWARDHRELRTSLDTTLFFDPIFAKHGYTFEDYNRSLYYYAGNPEKLNDIVSKFSKELTAEADRLQKLSEENENNIKLNKSYIKDYTQQDFSTDSIRFSQLDSAWIKIGKDYVMIGFLKPFEDKKEKNLIEEDQTEEETIDSELKVEKEQIVETPIKQVSSDLKSFKKDSSLRLIPKSRLVIQDSSKRK